MAARLRPRRPTRIRRLSTFAAITLVVLGLPATAQAHSIPILVDGRPDRIGGRLTYRRGPSIWPWLALLGVALALAASLASQRTRPRLVESVLVPGAAVAGTAAIVLSIGVGLVPGTTASAAWGSVLAASLISAVAVAVFAVAQRARHAIAGFVAILAVLIRLGDVGVLVHGYVISSLPASVVRAATAIAVGIGLVSAACAASLLFRDTGGERYGTPSSSARRQMAIPRGRPRTQ